LKNVSLRIPKRKITIFTGVSGSGKSSIVFDTIANEAQRLLNENFSLFIRNFLPRYPQPEADAIENSAFAEESKMRIHLIDHWLNIGCRNGLLMLVFPLRLRSRAEAWVPVPRAKNQSLKKS
jgi:hypothetical protein